jgi:hypothetical protein
MSEDVKKEAIERRSTLKATVKAHAAINRGISRDKAKMKYLRTDRQSESYAKDMLALDSQRRDARFRARSVNLAYGYVRGVAYKAMEPRSDVTPWARNYLAQRVADVVHDDVDVVLTWMGPREVVVAA